jgi:hypothetical protein
MTLNSGLKKNLVVVFIVMGYMFFGRAILADTRSNDIFPILDVTESLFKSMKTKDYPKIWSLISTKSHKIILNDVHKAIAKTNADIPMDSLRADFASGGRYAKEYWDAFLSVFDPDMALEHSKWEGGKINKNEGEVILLYKKSEKPAIIKVFKENDEWKVGLEETFRPRRMLMNMPWD